MRLYNLIKDLLVYGVLGFILVPIKFIFWLFSANGWNFLSSLPGLLKGGSIVSLLDLLKPLARACYWLLIAAISMAVFQELTQGGKIMGAIIKNKTHAPVPAASVE